MECMSRVPCEHIVYICVTTCTYTPSQTAYIHMIACWVIIFIVPKLWPNFTMTINFPSDTRRAYTTHLCKTRNICNLYAPCEYMYTRTHYATPRRHNACSVRHSYVYICIFQSRHARRVHPSLVGLYGIPSQIYIYIYKSNERCGLEWRMRGAARKAQKETIFVCAAQATAHSTTYGARIAICEK